VPPTENPFLKRLPYGASYLATLKAQHPTMAGVAIPASVGVAFYIVVSMMQHYAGRAHLVFLTTTACAQRPKLVVVFGPDIDIRSPDQVEWASAFRSHPARDVIIVSDLRGGTLYPIIGGTIPQDRRLGSAMHQCDISVQVRTNRKPPIVRLLGPVGWSPPNTVTNSSRPRISLAGRAIFGPNCANDRPANWGYFQSTAIVGE
jgi:hypothetical protein